MHHVLNMSVIEVILGGVILGGLYALVAIGFNLQYGMARIVNLAYGEFLMGAAFAAFWMFTLFGINPILGMAAVGPGDVRGQLADLSLAR